MNEYQLSFQEIQVDTQTFPVNIIELANKKSVRPKVAIKTKTKTSSLVIFAR
jgi:hypothetical protein